MENLKVPRDGDTPTLPTTCNPMGGASPQRVAGDAKDGSPATSGGARPVAKVSHVVSKPKSERFSER